MIWNEARECMSRDEMTAMQSARLVKLVNRVYHNVEFYRKKMQYLGIEPGDIKGIEDISKLPFTTKDDLRDNYPFGLLAVPHSEIVRVHASSGTTGKATVVSYTRKDIEVWQECVARVLAMCGVTREDKVQIAYGYGLFTGGLGLHYGVENLGAMAIPISTGNTKRLVTLMKDFEVTAIACTPSYLLHIAEMIQDEKIIDDIKLKVAICGAEPWTENMRNEIEKSLRINAHDIYGLSEVVGPGVAADCIHHKGLHVYEDHYYPEIVDADTLKPIPEGEVGELVFTTLTKEGMPLIRYRTKDLTSINYSLCECGRTLTRISRFKGRSDDMLIIRGVNVFPSQIEEVLLSMEDIGPHYEIIVNRENHSDILTIRVEISPDKMDDSYKRIEKLEKEVKSRLRTVLGLDAVIKLESPNTLQRFEGKAKRVTDLRKQL